MEKQAGKRKRKELVFSRVGCTLWVKFRVIFGSSKGRGGAKMDATEHLVESENMVKRGVRGCGTGVGGAKLMGTGWGGGRIFGILGGIARACWGHQGDS